MFRSTGAGAIRQIRHPEIGGRTHRANGKPPSCRWTMAIPSFSMETPLTKSQTSPRFQWADGRSSRVAKNSFQGKLPHSCVRNPRFFDQNPTISERSSRSAAHSLAPSLFSWPNLSMKTRFHPFSPCTPSIPSRTDALIRTP